jgi:hypothetical protein
MGLGFEGIGLADNIVQKVIQNVIQPGLIKRLGNPTHGGRQGDQGSGGYQDGQGAGRL